MSPRLVGRSRRVTRRPRGLRPFVARCEALEPRVVLTTTTALDPSFGTRGVVLGATSASDTNLSNATAVAVQADGKIVQVGASGQTTYGSISGAVVPFTFPGLAVRRFNTDGSVDTTFGTAGQLTISNSGFVQTPMNVAVEPDGSIVFAAVAGANSVGEVGSNRDSIVVRLTPAGQLDPTFGTNGEFSAPQADGYLTNVAVQADGSIVAAGYTPNTTATGSLSVIRLTTGGALDTTFNSTGQATVAYQTGGLPIDTGSPQIAALALTPSGEILVGGTLAFQLFDSIEHAATLAELRANGTLDSSFGTAGEASLPAAFSGSLGALAVQPDGSIVVAGGATSIALARLTAAGAVDPTFTPAATSSTTDRVNSVALGTDGSITAGGTTTIGVTSYPFVDRYLSTGAVDSSFGIAGRAVLNIIPTFTSGSTAITSLTYLNNVALTAGGDILVVGEVANDAKTATAGMTGASLGNQAFLARVLPVKTVAVANDYDGDGKADIAGVLGAFALYAYRPSSGAADVLAPFGPATVGAAIPAPGDYDGDGKADIAAYFPAYGALVYRPSSGGADVVVPFGIPGSGNTIPAPGDYDGDGKTDVAAYFPALGEFVYRPSTGGSDVVVPFGIPGAGNSIPAPGDYDGRTDPAVYLPSLGAFAYRPSSGGADVITQFGIAGSGQSIPAPGDYDGDGKTDLAVYLPTLGDYAYRPSSGGADVLTQFGIPGTGGSIPAPGDYDGDGRTDLAVYLPSIGYFAERPSSGGADVLSQFGASGTMQTVPAASIAAAFATTSTAAGSSSGTAPASSASVRDLALTDDLVSAEVAQVSKRKKTIS